MWFVFFTIKLLTSIKNISTDDDDNNRCFNNKIPEEPSNWESSIEQEIIPDCKLLNDLRDKENSYKFDKEFPI